MPASSSSERLKPTAGRMGSHRSGRQDGEAGGAPTGVARFERIGASRSYPTYLAPAVTSFLRAACFLGCAEGLQGIFGAAGKPPSVNSYTPILRRRPQITP